MKCSTVGRGGRGDSGAWQAYVRVWSQHPSLQSLLFDFASAVSLAMLVLSELFTRADAGLDERHLSDVGRGSRVMIVTPVNWYQVTSPVKLMMDRLVCADGGNPDPDPDTGQRRKLAKQIELEGWDYPRHLAGRLFSVVVHGDVEGVENVRRSVSDWLRFMQLSPAGPLAEVDRYIGYWKPYATNHEELDADTAIQDEVRNAAQTLLEAVIGQRDGQFVAAGKHLQQPRQK